MIGEYGAYFGIRMIFLYPVINIGVEFLEILSFFRVFFEIDVDFVSYSCQSDGYSIEK